MRLLHGDCVEVMRGLPECSVDAIVTDPPYGLEFMGKEWDRPWAVSATNGVGYAGRDDLTLPSHRDSRNANCRECGGRMRGAKRCACPQPKWDRHPREDMVEFQRWFEYVAEECLRVLKPGGHLLAFGGTRTYHRMACAIEDAGFEIRDSIHWVYGSGFPKSLDVSKAIDKRRDDSDPVLAVTRWLNAAKKASGLSNAAMLAHFGFNEGSGQIGHWTALTLGGQPTVPTWEQWQELKSLLSLSDEMDAEVWRLNGRKGQPGEAWHEREVVGTITHTRSGGEDWAKRPGSVATPKTADVTVAATDEAKRWAGWGTALKPAHEPVVVARKPLVGTVAGNVLAYGTGGLNIDGCRVRFASDEDERESKTKNQHADFGSGEIVGYHGWDSRAAGGNYNPPGRWPANVVFDRAAGEALDQQSGNLKPATSRTKRPDRGPFSTGAEALERYAVINDGGGGASRFFTQADFGPDDWPFVYQAKPSRKERNAGLDGTNAHPTVKPVALMRHLVRLVTPPGGVVLDPFAGSGTTLVAAILEGFDCIGIEMTDEYLPIIEGRMAWAVEQAAARGAEQARLL